MPRLALAQLGRVPEGAVPWAIRSKLMLIYRLAGRLGLALPVLLLAAPALASDAIDTDDTA